MIFIYSIYIPYLIMYYILRTLFIILRLNNEAEKL